MLFVFMVVSVNTMILLAAPCLVMCRGSDTRRADRRTPAIGVSLLAIVTVVGGLAASAAAGPVRASAPADDQLRIGLFAPHDPDDSFWSLFTGVARAAAADLGVDLVLRHASDSRDVMREQIEASCGGADPVAAVLFQNFKKGAASFMDVAASHDVPAFLVNAGLSAEESALLGSPRSVQPLWIGEMLPDDEATGFALAKMLIDAARARTAPVGSGDPIEMLAIEGVVSDGASSERVAGLRRALADRSDVHLVQIVAADWNRDVARRRCRILLKRHPGVRIVWAANDPMALGALDALGDLDRLPGRDVIVGGVDGTVEALDAVERGELLCTFGGHFMEGAWSVVLLFDYLQGADFAPAGLSYRSSMMLIDRSNVEAFRRLLAPARWLDWDFRAMSRHLNPDGPGCILEIGLELIGPRHAPVDPPAPAGPDRED